MKTLYINTCTKAIIIKMFNNNKLIREEKIITQSNNSQYIMPTVKKVVQTDNIDQIIVVNGPGSFTGVRLGVTIGKTLAYLKNIPIKTITSLEEMAISFNSEKKIVALEDNKGYYIGIFDKNNNLIGDYIYLSLEEYNKFIENNNVKTNVSIDDSKIIPHIKNKESVNPHVVKPLYVKLIDVEK